MQANRKSSKRVFVDPGQVFGRLTVIKEVEPVYYGNEQAGQALRPNRMILCRCECGSEKAVRMSHLRSGVTVSCGCFNREQIVKKCTKHGKNPAGKMSRAYRSWFAMKQRCLRKTHESYGSYGGRGITVCEKWMDFQGFYADMGDPPEGMSLERIDVDGDYCPENCKWATAKEQAVNKRSSKFYRLFGLEMVGTDWARKYGIDPTWLLYLLRNGRSLEQVLLDSGCIV